MKTVIAPGLRSRALKVDGWFSANILGNRDGEALADPESNKSKLQTKGSVLDDILGYHVEDHVVRIDYYRPRGDAKEAWDTIDLVGFLGEKMQLKLNFLCKDSILAAPLVLEIARLLDLAAQRGDGGIQEQLGVFFKAPMTPAGQRVEHALHRQEEILLRWLALHYLPSPQHVCAELARVAPRVLVGHAHDRLVDNLSPDEPLDPAGYAALLPAARCFDDAELTAAALTEGRALVRAPGDLRGSAAVAVVSGPTVLARERFVLPPSGARLVRNPLLGPGGRPEWPSERYAAEYGGSSGYLDGPWDGVPPTARMGPAVVELARARVLLDLPDGW